MAVQTRVQPTTGALHTLIVDVEERNLRYQYMYREGETVPPLATFQKSVDMAEIQTLTNNLSKALACSPSDESDLRLWGGKIFDRIIPQQLSDTFRQDGRSSYLVLYLDPAFSWIPWELLWDGEEFLCRRFRLSRLLQKSGPELRAAEERLKEARSGRGALLVWGDVSGLDANDEKAAVEENLKLIYGTNLWFYTARSASDILEELKKDYEICHFVGHGEFHADDADKTGWRFADGSVLSCHDIEAVSSRSTFPLLIFANSCDSARPAIPDTHAYITTLYRSFLKQGVPQYIGTAGRIPDDLSKEFALCFYRLLAAGGSVGEALGEARRLFSGKTHIPIWAYYIHYGDPTYRFVQRVRELPTAHVFSALQDILEYEQTPLRSEPFVDREKEILDAGEYIKRLGQDQSTVLLISGEAGVGKSAFLRRVCAEALQQVSDLTIAVGTCNLQFGLSDPYLPFKEIVRSLIRDTTRLPLPQGEARTVGELTLTELLLSFPQLIPVFRPDVILGSQRWEKVLERLRLSNRVEDESLTGLDQTVIFDQVSRLLRRISGAVRLILAVDSLHWADDSSVALFFHIGRTLENSRVLLIGSYRPDLLRKAKTGTEHPLKRAVNELRRYGAHTISLDLSTAKASELKRIQAFVTAYMAHALPGHYLPLSFLKKLAEHTGGNALFLTELVKYACEKDQIVRRNNHWELATEVEHFELPESVGGIIEERIEQLSEELRETLTFASIEGEDFTAEVLARLQNLDEDKVLNRLLEELHRIHQLVDEKVEQESGSEKVLSFFHFRSMLVQQHIYQELGAVQRRRLHKKVGEFLEELYGDKWADVAGQLAAHFRIAREWKKALLYAIEAARYSKRIYANHEAIRNYRVALELWELAPDKDLNAKLNLLQEVGEVYKNIANLDEALTTYGQILELAGTNDRRNVRAAGLNGLGDVHRYRGDYQQALPYYVECELIAQELSDENMLIEVWTDLTDLYYRLWMDALAKGAAEAAAYRAKSEEYGLRVTENAERLHALENLRRAYITLGNLKLHDKHYDEAESHYQEATALAERHNLPLKSLNNLGEIRRLQGQYDEALRYYTRCAEWATKTGAVRHEIMTCNNIGLVHLSKQDFEQARDFFDQALELNRPLRKRFSAVLSLTGKGLTFELQGATTLALDLYREAMKLAELPAAATIGDIYGAIGKLLHAYHEYEIAGYFLTKYADYVPAAKSEIHHVLNGRQFVQEKASQ